MRLDSLTPDQAAMMATVRDEWLAIGLATGDSEESDAHAAITAVYQAAGMEKPGILVWLDSPFAGAVGAEFLRCMPLSGAQVGDQVRDQVGDQVWAQVGAQVWAQVYRSCYGQHDAGWLAFYDFFRRLKVPGADRLTGMSDLAKIAGWWWPFKGAVVLTRRPIELHRDEQGRLHNEHGMAIRYRDGWGIHMIHGVRVPAWIIENPERITVATIDAESNAEIKRVMLERYGYERFLTDGGAELLDSHPQYGDLYHRPMGNGVEPLLCLVVTNRSAEPDGTFRRYVLGIHPECRPLLSDDNYGDPQKLTAHNAVASTFGLQGAQYCPAIET